MPNSMERLTAKLLPANLRERSGWAGHRQRNWPILPLLVLSLSLAAAPAARAQSPEALLLTAETSMESAISRLKEDLAAIAPPRMSAALFSRLTVNYYGSPTPVNQAASISVPEPRMAIIKPYDAQMLIPISNAINAGLGLSPSNDGAMLRVILPQFDEATRRNYIKTAKWKGDDAKVKIRNIRRQTNGQLSKALSDGTAAADDVKRALAELDSLMQKYVAMVDVLITQKEQQLLTV